MIRLAPISRAEARRFVAEHHRHSLPPLGGICQVALESEGKRIGVAVLGRPVSAALADVPYTAEITRVCVLDGYPNACSRLYGALCQAAKGLGYQRVITYTLARENGASLRASGFHPVADVKAERWADKARATGRQQPMPFLPRPNDEAKIRWERQVSAR